MAMFKAFKPEAMNKIAGAMGYTGNMDSFQQYIEQDPARKARMDGFVKAAQTMAKGGMVKKMQTGGYTGPDYGAKMDRMYNMKAPDIGNKYVYDQSGERYEVGQYPNYPATTIDYTPAPQSNVQP